MPTLEALITPSQAAEVLGVSKQRVLQLCDGGTLGCVRTPLGRLLRPDAVEALRIQREQTRAPHGVV